jgi:HK97 family phage major capsid protein
MKTRIEDLEAARSAAVVEARGILSKPRISTRDQRTFDQLIGYSLLLKGQIDAETEAENDHRSKPGVNTDEYRDAFRSYLRRGWSPSNTGPGISAEQRSVLTRGEHRDLGEGLYPAGGAAFPGTAAGFFVPASFEARVEGAMKDYGPMLALASNIDTVRGGPLAYPTDNDTQTAGEQLGEGTQVTTADIPLSSTVFSAYQYSSRMVKMSMELIQDSGIDIESYLADKFGQRFGRVLNPLLTNGSGTGQPKGVMTGLPASVTATGSASDDGSAATGGTSIGSDDLFALVHSVDPVYRRDGSFTMHDNTLLAIQKLKDKQGRPLKLWHPEPVNGSQGHIFGKGVWTNPDMATIAVNAVTVAFGDFSKYAVRRAGAMHIQRISERYAEYGQVGFIAWARRDGALLDAGTHPVKGLQQAAS